MIKKLLLIACMVLMLYADRNGGPYIGIGYGDSSIADKEFYSLEEKKSKGYCVYAGAYINRHLSVELEYVGALSYRQNSTQYVDFNLLHINTQAHYAFFEERLDFFVKFGVGEIIEKNSGFAMIYGAGAAWRFHKRFALKTGYDFIDFGVDINGDNSSDASMHIGYFFGAVEVQF